MGSAEGPPAACPHVTMQQGSTVLCWPFQRWHLHLCDFSSPFSCQPFSRDAAGEGMGLPAAAVDTLSPSTGERLSCAGWVLWLCHHCEMAPLSTACQLLSPLAKETLSSCSLLTFGNADLEKQALGGLACSEFVQGCKSVS